ncbi:amidohydrolase family protein [Kitasatospora kifunensis]|uniref:Aminocarboxymuconate-semialdehyde decarboxylase n=1 Tax=Kitasatospora kifunensis TaxID=58351 RepID=A0A7W7VZ51_KITKI|nr:amidohydrolase family protein [Kitasatospora kifunensis]MBB4927703.1 aminocarboxymuconate-semialdehyde decarboxylase [Kitasatospora kifunensis]
MTRASAGAIDVHAHAMPLELLRWLAARDLAGLDALPHGQVRLDPAVAGVPAGTPIPCPPEQYDLTARLAAMDATGCARQAVSLPPFTTAGTSTDEQLAAEVAAAGNDALAAHVGQAPDRLCALGTVPVGGAHAVAEARRCLDELGMAGVAIGTQGCARDLDDPVNEPLWAFLAERQAFTFLHPNASPAPARTAAYWLPQLVGYPTETAIAVARLVLGGVLDRHDLRLCLAHGGGCVPSLRGRLDLGWHRKEAARTTPLPPTAYLDRLYYDTAVFDPAALRQIVAQVGAEHVLLGTDFPFDLSDTDPLGTLHALGLSEADTRRVASETAARLLNIG